MNSTFQQLFVLASSANKLLYHATYHPNFDPKNVLPGTHFGTLFAAMSRARNQKRHDNLGKLKVHAFRYNTKGKSADISDTGANTSRDITDELYKAGKITKNLDPPSSTRILKGKEEQDAYRKGIDNHLHNELKKSGITHLTYKNRYEDPESTSQIIYD